MSSIERFFTQQVRTQHLVRDEANDTEVWEDWLPNVWCHIQTWTAGEMGYEGAKFPTHQMWCRIGTDIKEGDRVLDGENVYEVYSVEKLDFGHNPHLQVFLSLIKQEEGS